MEGLLLIFVSMSLGFCITTFTTFFHEPVRPLGALELMLHTIGVSILGNIFAFYVLNEIFTGLLERNLIFWSWIVGVSISGSWATRDWYTYFRETKSVKFIGAVKTPPR